MAKVKTVKREEEISRSRFVDCPVCNNRTLKLKRTVQAGRCKNCNETYKIIVVYVKTGRKNHPAKMPMENRSESKLETKAEPRPETTLPSWQLPSDTSLFSKTEETYPGLSEALFGETRKEQTSDSGSGNGK